ncbi:hypothetical protein [Ammoniphilus sp. 3BR4]|uniref:hypothetical protein n=1 Tax=Ammoniphilus sp. 3BR4 TaxID=3158265 RepID=UPI0034660FA0
MRQGIKEMQIAQTMATGGSADLKDSTEPLEIWEKAPGGLMGFGEGRELARRIGR